MHIKPGSLIWAKNKQAAPEMRNNIPVCQALPRDSEQYRFLQGAFPDLPVWVRSPPGLPHPFGSPNTMLIWSVNFHLYNKYLWSIVHYGLTAGDRAENRNYSLPGKTDNKISINPFGLSIAV